MPYREPEGVQCGPRRLALACTAAARLGTVEAFSRCLFQGVFVDGVSSLDDEPACGMPASIRPAFAEPSTSSRPRANLTATVAEAVARGVFGIPSFALGDELYFGNDRLVLLRAALLDRHTA